MGLYPPQATCCGNLKSEGITPEEIMTAILTHPHPDHIGGLLDTSGKPAFANAQYVMSKTEWDFWTSKPDLRGTGMDDHVNELLVNCGIEKPSATEAAHRVA
jgi:glyoxylase-like metal-dependent hydrolase (beta-lactamase superfamily II)